MCNKTKTKWVIELCEMIIKQFYDMLYMLYESFSFVFALVP